MENYNFKTLISFDSYIEAHLLKNRLIAEGIEAFLKDEFTVTIDPILSNAVGGIKIIVTEDQFEAAAMLVQKWKAEENAAGLCPTCHTGYLQMVSSGKEPANVISGLLGTLFGSYALAVKKHYKCFSCNAEFDELPEQPEDSASLTKNDHD